ncbi:exodeoxyribonuclease VII large subunit [Ruminiclostridium cellulolyticum]|uniref:Exodeoxyribonuclease 7 large subunit n=1 Tax=Ruminiclostridium cellulolyticum (strain ATCC 35319 / DSM 5812 / JCM 6584 / H10) TaxID=394503 RepID=EX7L_RUMCH|nr:exodeoxyribonuclease VII large subunit [Ruminiclostridium cellulolyticum]B8I3A9.1 RecName: Full=Exodeoxyribonuclease 7 large subunit; AltName: Full=Exodeoxyribonuclease VII large subunit; Short=Exonuclease VII large subunit [Ruminiclostridium cellulolyticum H10]ACL76252.1 exodeoxyribonuclease VII, large subunit [Ruminiclostridium cellulolyticum H10]
MNRVYSVSDINNYIKQLVSNDIILSDVSIRGEISNFKHHYTGHMYFTIKDKNSLLKCVMFRSQAVSLRFSPENGMKVIVSGYISVFERDGQYQLYASSMQPDGVGALHIAFEQLKEKLQREGLFDPENKKKIPVLPGSIGVVTSSTGAVIRDIINVTYRRNSKMKLVLYPVAVQGQQAAGQIAEAIKCLNEQNKVDVIIVARGGGSLEELWAFNEEIVARSIYASNIPVISAVGHETDFTICDFVSDMRAPTPSAAAELAVPDMEVLLYKLESYNMRMKSSLAKKVTTLKNQLQKLNARPFFAQPYDRVNQQRQTLDNLTKSMVRENQTIIKDKKSQFGMLAGKLDALSPLKILERGYSLVKNPQGYVVNNVKQINIGDKLEILMNDGLAECDVISVREGKIYE